MGVYTTLIVSRHAALTKIQEALETATNEQLESVLFDLVGEQNLLNFTVARSMSDDDDELMRLGHE